MSHRTTLFRAALAGALWIALAPAHAASGALQGASGYYQSCLQSVEFPRPFGEWDLKGNAKLPVYCACYSDLFGARAMNVADQRQRNGGKAVGTAQEHTKEELAMRNTCRKKLSLPEVTEEK